MDHKINEQFDAALALYKGGRLDESIQRWHEILNLEPNYTDALYSLGTTLLEKGDFQESIHQFQKVLNLDPQDARARINLAIGLFAQGDLDSALTEFEQVLKNEPANIQAYTGIGSVYLQKAEKENSDKDRMVAQNIYQKALSLDPHSADALHGIGLTFWQLAKYTEAIDFLIAAVAADPTDEAAFFNLYWMECRVLWRSLRSKQWRQAGLMIKRIIQQRRLPYPSSKHHVSIQLK